MLPLTPEAYNGQPRHAVWGSPAAVGSTLGPSSVACPDHQQEPQPKWSTHRLQQLAVGLAPGRRFPGPQHLSHPSQGPVSWQSPAVPSRHVHQRTC